MNDLSDGTTARDRRNPIAATLLSLLGRRYRPRIQTASRQKIFIKSGSIPGIVHSPGTARRAIARLLLMSAALCACLGCAVASKKVSTREIDRPLNDPAGTKRVTFEYLYIAPWYRGGERWRKWDSHNLEEVQGYADAGRGVYYHGYEGFFIPVISYAVTDRISFPALPSPVVYYHLYGNNRVSGDTVAAPELSIAVIAGLQRNFIYPMQPIIGMMGKKRLSPLTWLSFNASASSTLDDILNLTLGSGIGLQAGDRNSFRAGICLSGDYFLNDNCDYWPNPITYDFRNFIRDNGRFLLKCAAPVGWNTNLRSWITAGFVFQPEIRFVRDGIYTTCHSEAFNFQFLW